MTETPRRIGILFGMERHFPPALATRINEQSRGRVVAGPVEVGCVRQEGRPPYDVILDRISHDVPFYRCFLKSAAAHGVQVVNNPFWWSADDKFLDNIIAQAVGVSVPKTVILPHKSHPPNTTAESFSNLRFPLEWDDVFGYLGFPIFLKPATGGGWRNVYKVSSPEEFFGAFDSTGDLCMMAQEAIEFTEYYRCYVIGRRRVRVMRYEPRAPFHERYVKDSPPPGAALTSRLERDCLALCRALGYDFNTVELAVRDGIPYAIDFMNPAPDCDPFSVGHANFDWVLEAAAEFLIDRATNPAPPELTGDWVSRLGAAAAPPARSASGSGASEVSSEPSRRGKGAPRVKA